MKKLLTILFILFILPLFSFSQDYWELLHTNDTTTIYSIIVSNDGTIYYGGYGGLFISHDDGITWECKPILFYLGIYSMAFDLDSNLIIGATNYLYKYKIYDDEWELLLHPEETYGFSAILIDSNEIFAGTATKLYRFKDGSWSDLGYHGSNDIVEDNEGRLFIGYTSYTGGGGVWQSLDRGDTWTLLGLYDSYVADLAIDSQDRLYAGSTGHQEYGIGGLYRYNREEGIWDTLRLYHRVMSMCFNEEDSLYIGQYSTGGPPAGAFMSPDFGNIWYDISSGFQGGGIPNVKEIITGPDNHLYAIMYDVGSMYKSTNTTITSIPEQPLVFKDRFEIYPNPFKGELFIKNNLPDVDSFQIKIFTISGQLIYQDFTHTSDIDNLISIDIAQILNPGIYILQLTDRQFTYIKKIVKH